MIFSTYSFLLVFLPIVVTIYFSLARFGSRKIQFFFLILASLFFYGYNSTSYIWLILTSIFVNYSFASAIQKVEKKTLQKTIFVIGILFNVCLLGYYKYYDFFVENVNDVFSTDFTLKKIMLPLGISFFTFQQLIFLINIRKKELAVPNIIDYTLFVTFFPSVVSGPITMGKDIFPQYNDDKNRYFNTNNFSQGLYIFTLGLFKKAAIADSIFFLVSKGFDYPDKLTFGTAWISSLLYTVQIYFDFSGYSEMALGLAKMLNINIPINFNSPYKANSITDFWKRWHITLGRSLATLVYFPLGGNRKGYTMTCVNLFIVFLVSGIWHGSAWTFVVWGIMHGILRVFEKIFEKQLDKIPHLIRVFFTFMYVNVVWVLFRSPSFSVATNILKKMFAPDKISFANIEWLAYNNTITYPKPLAIAYVLFFLFGSLAIIFLFPKNNIDRFQNFKPTISNAILIAFLMAVSIVHFSKVVGFIYFNF